MKYAKYIGILLLVIVCIFLVWYIFFKENKEIQQYMEKFNSSVEVTQNDIQKEDEENKEDNNVQNDEKSPLIPEVDNEKDNNQSKNPNEGQEIVPNVEDKKPVILTSETEMLNKQGEELLKELSKELEESILTIEQSTGVVDNNILEKDN